MEGYLGNILFYMGIGIMVAASVALVIAVICLHASKRKLDRHLDAEFGKKRH